MQTQLSCFKTMVGQNHASTKCNSKDQQSDETYPDLQAFFETDVDIPSVTDKHVNSVKICGARKRSQGIEENVPPNASVVKIHTVAKALGPKDIERLSQGLPPAHTQFTEFRKAESRKNFREVNHFAQLFLSLLATLKQPFSTSVNWGSLLRC